MPLNATPYEYVKVDKKTALEGLASKGISSENQVMLLRKSGASSAHHVFDKLSSLLSQTGVLPRHAEAFCPEFPAKLMFLAYLCPETGHGELALAGGIIPACAGSTRLLPCRLVYGAGVVRAPRFPLGAGLVRRRGLPLRARTALAALARRHDAPAMWAERLRSAHAMPTQLRAWAVLRARVR